MNLNKLRLTIFILISVLLCETQLMAQDIDENNFKLYTKQQGLSNNLITGIAQDSIGYIWIATPSGLNRFNGTDFVQFHSYNDSTSIPGESLTGLVFLDKYRFSIFADGLHIINTCTGASRNLFIPYSDKQYQYKFNWIRSVYGNPQGEIFVLTKSGFYHFDQDYNLVFRFDYYSKDQVPVENFTFGKNLFCLDTTRLAIVGIDGLYYYDINKRSFRKISAANCPLVGEFLDTDRERYQPFQLGCGSFFILDLESDKFYYVNGAAKIKTVTHLPFSMLKNEFDYRSELTTINDSTYYLTGNSSGFYKIKLDIKTGRVDFNPEKYFQYYFCRHLLQDRDNNLWIATNKGLFRQSNSRSHIKQFKTPSVIEDAFPNTVIDDVFATRDKIYAATRGNSGLLVFNKQKFQFIRQVSFQKYFKTSDNLYAIAAIDTNSLLVTTNGPLFKINNQTNHITELPIENWYRPNDWASDLYKDRKQNIWVAGRNIYKYEESTGKFSTVDLPPDIFNKLQNPNNIKEDTAGNIWISGHGLLRYNVSTKTVDQFLDSFPFIKIPDKQVISFTIDPSNNIWINSNNNGLICYNIEKKNFRHFTHNDGLPDNNIASMIVIGNKLWLATYSGIACLDLHTSRITSFDSEDGFPDLPIANGAKFFYDSAANKLYIGFTNTIVQFDPDIIFQNKQIPHLFIESLTTSSQKKFDYPGKNISLSLPDNEFTVTIGSINFLTGSSQRFAYRLIKEDSTKWQQLGLQNSFTISNLSPGFHRIQVKLYSLNNRWPEQVSEFSVYIIPPFWRKEWFMALFVAFLSVCVYLLLKWRTSYIRKQERAKTHIEKLKADEYKNQFELEHISNYFSSSLVGKNSVDEVLWDVTKNLIGRMNYVDCIIYMWDKDKTKMIQKAAFGPKGNPKTIATTIFDVMPGQGIVGHVMLTKEPQLVPNTRNDHRYRVDDMSRLSELCVPIIHDDELIGIIDSEHHEENHFDDRDVKILTTIATLLGNKIKQIESENSLQKQQKEIAYINQQLAEAQLSALQTQMNPHFIFNSLNGIKGMILDNEQQKASRYLSKFANMIRTTLNQSKEIFTTLYENIEHLENYLVMEKLRFDDSFTFRIIIDDNIDKEETLIPTLMIQPLAENAIWHGLMYKKGRKNLTIRFSKLGEIISCYIEDNGIGINQSEEMKKTNRPSHRPVGLSNLRNRIKIMNEKYDTGCTLEIIDLSEFNREKTGTCAVLRFNIITNKIFI
ncbi:MAG: histidine kinase [Bacteroidetes bacterium]|nr:histidine kinase [Bacteroidota bacterium]